MATTWRDRLLTQLSPELLAGVSFGRWCRILWDNSLSVDLPFWPRATVTTLFSLRNSAAAAVERLVFQRTIGNTEVAAPVFILGIFRSGTSYLQNLMAQDSRLAYPSMYEVTFPETFLTTQRIDSALLGRFLPGSRPQDNVALAFDCPHEDEVAFCSLLGRTFLLDVAFPRNTEFYRRYYTLKNLSRQELDDWKDALKWFAKKLTYRHQRPLVFKSPGHTCRIRRLLEVFPDAKFVHIHRDPFEVYQSWQHLIRVVSDRWGFQCSENVSLEDDILQQYAEVYDAYLEERDLIPQGRLHEIPYSALRSDPIGQLNTIYNRLNLPDFAEIEGTMQGYVTANSAYRQNEYAPMDHSTRQRIASEWKRFFLEWGYVYD